MNNRDAFYRIEIVTEAGEVPETSADIRLFYVVDGGLCVKKEGSPYSLAKFDLILIGAEETTEIAGKGSGIKESEDTDQHCVQRLCFVCCTPVAEALRSCKRCFSN